MTLPEFSTEFARLENHFRLNDDDRMTIFKDWFKALAHYHVDAVSQAIDQVIEQSTDTFWPALGKLTGAIKEKLSRYEHTRRECATCDGSTWIEARPWKWSGLIYEGVIRCPDCGVPAPATAADKYRKELTRVEYAQWSSDRTPSGEPSANGFRLLQEFKTRLMARMSMPAATIQREPGEEG